MEPAVERELLQLLASLCSPEQGARRGAEEALKAGQLTPGFAGQLAVFAAAGPSACSGTDAITAVPLRQMALTILKRLAKNDWAEVPPGDQTVIRGALIGAIADESKGMRGLVHACLSAIQQQDREPRRELHAQLSAGLAQGNAREAACCLECVVELLDYCGVEVAMALAPMQEPMLRLASNDASPPELRRRCVDAHIAAVASVLSCRGEGIPEMATQSVVAGVPGWLSVHSALCAGVEGWSDADRVACAFTALRTVTALSRYRILEEALTAHIETVLRPACLLVQRIEPAYESAVIMANDGGASEEDGGVSQLIAQLMELLQAMLVMPKMRKLIKSHTANMLKLLVPFMRITEAQATTWREDPNAFLAQEDDEHVRGCAVRLSGEGLVGEMLDHTKREASKALAALVAELLERGEKGREAGDQAAWKLTEVALFLFAHAAAEQTAKSLQRGDLAAVTPTALSLAGRLCADAAAPDFLRARAFAVLRRLGDVVVALVPADVQPLLGAAAAGLSPSTPLVVRVNACRVFCRFLTAVDDMATREACLIQGGVLPALGALLQQADEEMLHLALESICVISKQCPSAMAAAEASFSPLVLDIWRRSATDPLVHLQVLDLVSCAAASDPRLQRSLEERLIPEIHKDLSPETEAIKVASAIELFGVLLKRAELPLRTEIMQVIPPLLTATMKADESGLLQNSCEVLSSLVKRSPSQLVERGLPGPILRCVERLLGPGLDDDACVYVAPLVTLLFDVWEAQLPPDLVVGLVRALITRLAAAELPYLKQELIVALARLLHKDLPGTLTALTNMQVPCAGGASESGLSVLLATWLARAKEIRARRARNVTVSALCQIHQRCGVDQGLAALRVGTQDAGPLADQLLAAITSALEFENERCRKLKEAEAAGAFDDDEEDDDDDDEEIDDDEFLGGAVKGAGMGKLLSELVDLEDLDSDEEEDDEPGGGIAQELERADPFAKLDLQRYAADYLAANSGTPQPGLSQRLVAAVSEARTFAS